MGRSNSSLLLTLLIIAYTAFFTTQLTLHYYSFGSRSLDLGNMNQAIWNTLHGRPFHQTNQPGATSRFSLHVEPILLPISLLYLIYSGPEILFLLQSVVVALGAWPLFALARLRLEHEWLALIFAALYLMFPPLQGATLLDFHAVTLAPTFLLAAFYYLETGHSRLFGLFALLAAACKEDMALIVLMLGVYALVVNRQYKVGLATILLAGVWALLAVFVIPPYFAGTENIHWGRYDHLGASPLAIILNFFTQPGLVLGHLRAVDAPGYLVLLLTPTALTALLNPPTLLLALPSLGINLLSNYPPMQEVNALIYAAPLTPAIFISSVYGVANLQRLVGHANSATLNRAFGLLIAGLLLLTSYAYHARYGYLPWGGQYRGWEQVTPHHRRAGGIFSQIPPQAALSAHDRLNPHVSGRETVYIFDRIEEADYIVLDVTEDSWPLHPVELRHRVDELLAGEFGVVEAMDGYLLLAKGRPDLPKALPAPFFDFARAPQPTYIAPQYPANVVFDGKLRLRGYDLSLGAHEQRLPVVTLYWQALEPLAEDYTLWPFFIDAQGGLIEEPRERPLVVTLWYPTSRWQPDEVILTPTLPYDLGPRFTLAVGVARQDWAETRQRLPITEAGDLYTFAAQSWARLATFRQVGRGTYEAIPAPPMKAQPQHPREATFWQILHLRGADLPAEPLRAGQALSFALYWESDAPLPVDLNSFAHLLDEEGAVVAQLDWTPQDALGYLPTTAWQPGRLVVDRQTTPLSMQVPPGSYRLVVGWYYPATGDRLPVTVGGAGEVVEVGVIRITG
jgi:uncharacterized membrane protein